jgi:hypothetical protein
MGRMRTAGALGNRPRYAATRTPRGGEVAGKLWTASLCAFLAASLSVLASCESSKATATAAVRKTHPAPRPPEDREDLRRRRQWWTALRSSPAGPPPATAFAQARAQWSALPRDLRVTEMLSPPKGRNFFSPVGPTWVSVGPEPFDGTPVLPNMGLGVGRATAVAVDPTNSQTLFIGYALGGVWKSVDGGNTWNQVTPNTPSLAIGAILIDPSNPNTIYVGTGEGNLSGDAYYGQGVLKSTDGGATWSTLGAKNFSGSSFTELAIDPTNGDLYASTDTSYDGFGDECFSSTDSTTGLWHSSNAGATWTLLAPGSWASFSVDFTTAPPRTFLLSDAYYGLYSFSESTGQTTQLSSPLPNAQSSPSLFGMTLRRAPSNPAQIYSGVGVYPTGASTLYASPDNGTTWTQLSGVPDFCSQQCDYDNVVIVDPMVSDTLYLGGSLCPVWKGTGVLGANPTWTAITMPSGCADAQNDWVNSNVHADVHQLALDPADSTILYVATDDGAARGHNDGASWDHLTNGMATLQFYAICLDANDPSRMFGGMQDNGSAMRSGTTLTWTGVITGDGGHCVINAASPNNVLASSDNGYLLKATDGFANPANAAYVFDTAPSTCAQFGTCNDRVAFIPPMVGDPNTPDIVYLGTNRLWQSTDFGSTWTPITGDLTGGVQGQTCQMPPVGDYLTALEVDASGAVYTGSAGGHIYHVSGNGSQVVELTQAPLPNRLVSAIAVDPTNAQHVFVAFGGFNGGTPKSPGHVFSSTNGGQTWRVADPTNFDMPIYDLVAHPTRSGVLFASTDFGVMATPNSGETWGQIGEGIPPATVATLAFHASANMLVAGTHGRSAWELSFGGGPTLVSVTPSTGPISGGQVVNLTGTGFWDGMTVSFGGTVATSVKVASLTSAQVTTPAHAAGSAGVTVINLDGSTVTAPAAYTYAPPPSISSVSPASGPSAGGTSVIVTGSNFAPAATLTFGGVPALNGSATSAAINAVTPASKGPLNETISVDVVVTNPDGQSATLPKGFEYVAAKSGCGCSNGPESELLGLLALRQFRWRRRRATRKSPN